MGAVLAKFRKAKTTEKRLEELQEKIQQIEKYSLNTQEQKKTVVGRFLTLSIGIYVAAFLIFYFIYFPPTWRERLVYLVPMLLFPFVIILLRKVFTWHFQRKLNKNSQKLKVLRAEKKLILEQVMDKETYKVAVGLLARYSDASSRSKAFAMSPHPSTVTLNQSMMSAAIQRRGSPTTTHVPATPVRLTTSSRSLFPRPTVDVPQDPPHVSSSMTALAPRAPMPMTPRIEQELRRRTPFPIINQQDRNVLERIVDVLVGDGPQDRFAMICKECFGHNGMALKEDFEYATFRCAYCNVLNPSRKARPSAPLLPTQQQVEIAPLTINSSGSSSASDNEDSDYESRKIRHSESTEHNDVAEAQTAHSETKVNDKRRAELSASAMDLDSGADDEEAQSALPTKSSAYTDLNAEFRKLMSISGSSDVDADAAVQERASTLQRGAAVTGLTDTIMG